MQKLTLALFILFLIACRNDTEITGEETVSELYQIDYDSPENKWGFIDESGRVVIAARYDAVKDFQNGLAAVNLNSKWGFIDKNGNPYIDFKYMEVLPFTCNVTLVKDFELNWLLINKSNEIIDSLEAVDVRSFNNGLALYKGIHFWNAVDTSGYHLFQQKYSHLKIINSYLLGAKNFDQYALIDTADNLITNHVYDNIYPEKNDFIRLKKNGVFKYYNASTKSFGHSDYDLAFDYDNSHTALVKEHNQYHIIDSTEKIIQSFDYMHMLPLGSRLLSFRQNGLFGLISYKGEILHPAELDYLHAVSENRIVASKNGLFGYLDFQGNWVVSPRYRLA